MRAVEPRIGKTRKIQGATQQRLVFMDPTSELHQGQRSCAPHRRAKHMTAPDRSPHCRSNSLAPGGRVFVIFPISNLIQINARGRQSLQ